MPNMNSWKKYHSVTSREQRYTQEQVTRNDAKQTRSIQRMMAREAKQFVRQTTLHK